MLDVGDPLQFEVYFYSSEDRFVLYMDGDVYEIILPFGSGKALGGMEHVVVDGDIDINFFGFGDFCTFMYAVYCN